MSILYGLTCLDNVGSSLPEETSDLIYLDLEAARKKFIQNKRGANTPLLFKFDKDEPSPLSLDHLVQIGSERSEACGDTILGRLPKNVRGRVSLVDYDNMGHTVGPKYEILSVLIPYISFLQRSFPECQEAFCSVADNSKLSTEIYTATIMVDAYIHQLSRLRKEFGFTETDRKICSGLKKELEMVFKIGMMLGWESLDETYLSKGALIEG